MATHQYVVIVGCGRLGSLLANRLSRAGASVVVVDRDPSSFDKLSGEFSGFQILGNAAELAVLRQAKIEQADCVLAVTRRDNVNLMVAQIAKIVYNVPQVIARVFNLSREDVYRGFGVDTICPTRLSADAFLSAMGELPEVSKA